MADSTRNGAVLAPVQSQLLPVPQVGTFFSVKDLLDGTVKCSAAEHGGGKDADVKK